MFMTGLPEDFGEWEHFSSSCPALQSRYLHRHCSHLHRHCLHCLCWRQRCSDCCCCCWCCCWCWPPGWRLPQQSWWSWMHLNRPGFLKTRYDTEEKREGSRNWPAIFWHARIFFLFLLMVGNPDLSSRSPSRLSSVLLQATMWSASTSSSLLSTSSSNLNLPSWHEQTTAITETNTVLMPDLSA